MKIFLSTETHVLCKPGIVEVSNAEASRLYALGIAKPVTVPAADKADEAAAEPAKKKTKKTGK